MTDVLAPAKLTWYLEITGVRANGMHEIRSEMTTIDFADQLSIDPSDDYVHLTGHTDGVPDDERNLVVRALQLVGQRAGVRIDKRIPTGGGLGGGSADAAAVLRYFGGVTEERALLLGGDVPFCQLGGRALVEGVGERLTPLGYQRRDVTLVMPDFSIDTRSCYEAYDVLATSGGNRGGPNHLESAAVLVEPRLGVILTWLRATYGDEVQLAGSGSTMFIAGHVSDERAEWVELGPTGQLRFRKCSTTPS
jgi:4-diphosphocytidyl-2-C-methyl-D-erythritol kinase